MKFWDNGNAYTVEYNESEVVVWARRWPGFGVPRGKVWFVFSKKTGDLVDMSDTAGLDESGVVALSHDAQTYGLEKLAQLPNG